MFCVYCNFNRKTDRELQCQFTTLSTLRGLKIIIKFTESDQKLQMPLIVSFTALHLLEHLELAFEII